MVAVVIMLLVAVLIALARGAARAGLLSSSLLVVLDGDRVVLAAALVPGSAFEEPGTGTDGATVAHVVGRAHRSRQEQDLVDDVLDLLTRASRSGVLRVRRRWDGALGYWLTWEPGSRPPGDRAPAPWRKELRRKERELRREEKELTRRIRRAAGGRGTVEASQVGQALARLRGAARGRADGEV